MVPEAELTQTEAGLVPASPGWFVMNARDALVPARGPREPPLDRVGRVRGRNVLPHAGMSLQVIRPGEANAGYHWETEQEDFLVLSGEALLIVEGQERPVKRWDFVHCPA